MRLSLAFALGATVALAACGPRSASEPVQEAREAERQAPALSVSFTFERASHGVLKDHETGCEYILIDKGATGGTAITPRLDATGNQVCAQVDGNPKGGDAKQAPGDSLTARSRSDAP
jgi:hypothetical protein